VFFEGLKPAFRARLCYNKIVREGTYREFEVEINADNQSGLLIRPEIAEKQPRAETAPAPNVEIGVASGSTKTTTLPQSAGALRLKMSQRQNPRQHHYQNAFTAVSSTIRRAWDVMLGVSLIGPHMSCAND
jgi:hypothetical protein